jgi:hypothetical protein
MLDTLKTNLTHFWDRFQNDMGFNKKMHGWLAIFWFVASIPICIWLNTSVPLLVFISVYAVVGFHWNIWFNTKIEKKHEDNPVEEAILDKLDKETDVEVNSTTTKEEITVSTEKD